MSLALTEEKKKNMEKLVKSFKELDAAILPFQEQRKDLKNHYVENDWLTEEEFALVKKAYNTLKRKVNLDDLSIVIEAVKGVMPSMVEDV